MNRIRVQSCTRLLPQAELSGPELSDTELPSPAYSAPAYSEPVPAYAPQPSFPHYEPRTEGSHTAVAGRIAPANKPVPTQAAPVAQRQARSPTRNCRSKSCVPSISPRLMLTTPSEFRPGLEVEQFAWMPLIDNLCHQQQIGFDRVLLELEAELAADRRIIALTSVKRGEGRTTMLQCLARRAAEMGLRVCIVDLDDAKPALAEQLGLAIDSGWEQVVFAGKPLADCCVEANRDALTAVLLKQALQPGALAQQTIAASAMLLELREQFDLVLIDTRAADADSAATEGRSTTANCRSTAGWSCVICVIRAWQSWPAAAATRQSPDANSSASSRTARIKTNSAAAITARRLWLRVVSKCAYREPAT